MNLENAASASDTLICPVTPWFYRRMGILGAMLLFMGLYFIYDGKIGYRKDNVIADKKGWFDQVFLKSFDEAKAAGQLENWVAKAKAEGLPSGENGEPPKWASFAAQRGWPEQAKKHGEDEIFQQFEWGGGMLLLALIVGGKVLLDRGKKLTGHAEHMVMPDGAEVRFADVFKVDKRKWDNKGLAYVHYRTSAGGVKRASVDDLKYDGAGRVLDRLLGQFKGELIEKVQEPETPPSTAPGDIERTP